MEVLNVTPAPTTTNANGNNGSTGKKSQQPQQAVITDEAEAEAAHESRVIVSPDGAEELDFAALVEQSSDLNDMEVVLNLTAEYIQLNAPGDSFRGIYYGNTEITVNDMNTGEQKTLPAAQFIVNRQMRINGGTVLVNEINKSKVRPGTPVEIRFERQENRVKIYSVSLLGGK